jgi:replicative DNA helicase
MTLNSLDAEQAVIGAVLFDNAIMERVGFLQPEYFYDMAHAALWREVSARIQAGRAVDASALKEWWTVNVTGSTPGQLLDMFAVGAAVLTVDAIERARTIRDLWARRNIVSAAQDAIHAANQGIEALDVLASLEADLKSLDLGEESGDGLPDASDAFISGMDRPMLSTGIRELDRRWGGLAKQDLIILGGRPSMGKTTMAANIARNVAGAGKVVHFQSAEMSKEQLARRALSAATFNEPSAMDRVEYFHMRHGATGLDRNRLRELGRAMPRHFWIDDRAAPTLAQIEASARATRRRFGRLDLLVVDYLQLVRATRSDGRVNEVSEISAGLKGIAKRLNCPLLALSQLSRAVESREDKRPVMNDLRESGSIEQDADLICFAYRESYYHERAEPDDSDPIAWNTWSMKRSVIARQFEAITAKNRQGPVGADTLEAFLEFDTIRGRAA